MYLINRTDYKNDFIKKIVEFAMPSGTKKPFLLVVRYGSISTGICYDYFPIISVTLEKNAKYPLLRNDKPRTKNYIRNIPIESEMAHLVFLVAHESGHYLSNGKLSEGDCDAYAIHTVSQWRIFSSF